MKPLNVITRGTARPSGYLGTASGTNTVDVTAASLLNSRSKLEVAYCICDYTASAVVGTRTVKARILDGADVVVKEIDLGSLTASQAFAGKAAVFALPYLPKALGEEIHVEADAAEHKPVELLTGYKVRLVDSAGIDAGDSCTVKVYGKVIA